MRGCRNTTLGSLDEAGEKASTVMKSSSGGGDVSGGCYLQLSSRRLEKPLVDFEKKTRKHPLNESKRHNRSLRVREMNDNLGIMGLLRVKRRRRKKFVYRKIRRKLTTMAALKLRGLFTFDATPLSDSLKLHYFGESDMYPLAFLRVRAT
ncbi:hypothetical protein KY290_025980 [Solanum tuberosum]|uniref:Uncharacterized protein n=1 Tax=Solanum tuberosum TaxID=4113 RepID=A0ABQ7UY83_SOLTU|nr:hypothetical protein KY284_024847 [Solanum tuberosum]KAH0721581.1 hypothetical protein KY284_006611 [Solanum tuberosum]KAH0755710.1 hypothetical protein KY290_025980 [Solanum tuberosum]